MKVQLEVLQIILIDLLMSIKEKYQSGIDQLEST